MVAIFTFTDRLTSQLKAFLPYTVFKPAVSSLRERLL